MVMEVAHVYKLIKLLCDRFTSGGHETYLGITPLSHIFQLHSEPCGEVRAGKMYMS